MVFCITKIFCILQIKIQFGNKKKRKIQFILIRTKDFTKFTKICYDLCDPKSAIHYVNKQYIVS